LLYICKMRNWLSFLGALVALSCLWGCNKDREDDANVNALVISPANVADINRDILSRNGTVVYPIGSVFIEGMMKNRSEVLRKRYYFCSDKYTEEPEEGFESVVVFLSGYMYPDTEYTLPGQHIDLIVIYGLDESLGLGKKLTISLEQGEYKGDNDLIKDVQIVSLKQASVSGTSAWNPNKDADIRILIYSKRGDVLSISYVNDVTLPRGNGGAIRM